MEKFIANLQALAGKKGWSDDEEFMVYDYCGGNMDDAYEGGFSDGEIQLARHLLAELEKLGLVKPKAA